MSLAACIPSSLRFFSIDLLAAGQGGPLFRGHGAAHLGTGYLHKRHRQPTGLSFLLVKPEPVTLPPFRPQLATRVARVASRLSPPPPSPPSSSATTSSLPTPPPSASSSSSSSFRPINRLERLFFPEVQTPAALPDTRHFVH